MDARGLLLSFLKLDMEGRLRRYERYCGAWRSPFDLVEGKPTIGFNPVPRPGLTSAPWAINLTLPTGVGYINYWCGAARSSRPSEEKTNNFTSGGYCVGPDNWKTWRFHRDYRTRLYDPTPLLFFTLWKRAASSPRGMGMHEELVDKAGLLRKLSGLGYSFSMRRPQLRGEPPKSYDSRFSEAYVHQLTTPGGESYTFRTYDDSAVLTQLLGDTKITTPEVAASMRFDLMVLQRFCRELKELNPDAGREAFKLFKRQRELIAG